MKTNEKKSKIEFTNEEDFRRALMNYGITDVEKHIGHERDHMAVLEKYGCEGVFGIKLSNGIPKYAYVEQRSGTLGPKETLELLLAPRIPGFDDDKKARDLLEKIRKSWVLENVSYWAGIDSINYKERKEFMQELKRHEKKIGKFEVNKLYLVSDPFLFDFTQEPRSGDYKYLLAAAIVYQDYQDEISAVKSLEVA